MPSKASAIGPPTSLNVRSPPHNPSEGCFLHKTAIALAFKLLACSKSLASFQTIGGMVRAVPCGRMHG
jgi:hypothetical protein